MNSTKRNILMLMVLICSIGLQAQTAKLTIFSEDGYPFWLVIDGSKINQDPSPRVVANVDADFIRVKIIFSDEKIKDISKSLQMVNYDSKRVNCTYNLKKNKKGEIDLRLSNFEDINSTPVQNSNQTAKPATPPPANNTTNVVVKTDGDMDQDSETITQTTTMQVDGLNFGTNVNADGQNIGMNVSISGLPGATTTTTTSTTTTTTSLSSSNSNAVRQNPNTRPTRPAPTPTPAPVEVAKPAGCVNPVSNDNFQRGLSSVKNASFADEKEKIARQFTKNNCLSVNQILEMMKTFSFEENKLNYAKFAYDFCTEKGNYFQVNDGLTFSSSKDDLNEFLETK